MKHILLGVRMFIAKRLLVRMKKQHDLHMEALRQLRLRQNEAATTIEKSKFLCAVRI